MAADGRCNTSVMQELEDDGSLAAGVSRDAIAAASASASSFRGDGRGCCRGVDLIEHVEDRRDSVSGMCVGP